MRYSTLIAIAFALMLERVAALKRKRLPRNPATRPRRRIASGKRVFESAGCAACHGAQGQGTTLAPQIAPPPMATRGR